MKKYLFIIAVLMLNERCKAQSECFELNAFLDSLHQLNVKRMSLGEDTGLVRQFYRNNYRQLLLYGKKGRTGGYSSTHIYFEVDMTLLTQIHQCLVQKADQKGWYIKWHDPDENGFRRVSIYDTKKEKNSILFYDDIFKTANMEKKTGSFNLAFSLYW